MITILTPAYNRGYVIHKAYKSLLQQKNKDFEWVVIDDGSTDNTKEVIEKFIDENKINISYYRKKNGGKHTALNYGIKKAKGDYILILDSDDYLTDECLTKVKKYIDKYDSNPLISGLSFLRQYPNGKIIGKRYQGSEIISNNIDFRYNNNLLGDMCEVYKKEVLLKYPFPVFKNERFLSEAIVWNQIAFDYQTVYINEPILVCEYLEDGLSNSCLISRIKSPKGSYENAKVFLNKKFKLSLQVKNAIIYTGFYLISNDAKSDILEDINNKGLIILLFPLGFLFYLYLLFKLKEEAKK